MIRHGQGHSILITSGSAICQGAIEVHGVAPEGVGDVVDLVEPQDVEGEAAQDREDGGAFADPAGVLVHGGVQYVAGPVLHAPVAARRGGVIRGAVAFPGRGIPCDFVCALPFPAGVSFSQVMATSAPVSRKAVAQPYAIECSLAMPTTSAFCPARTWG
jgi:hypothetical protein